MTQKEDYKYLRDKLEENLILLEVPRYIWHWGELLKATLFLLASFFPPDDCRRRKAWNSWKIAREIYG